jgi:hypothetical protein
LYRDKRSICFQKHMKFGAKESQAHVKIRSSYCRGALFVSVLRITPK